MTANEREGLLWIAFICGCSALLAGCLVAPEQPVRVTPKEPVKNCRVLPADHIWNQAVNRLPLDLNSRNYVRSMGAHLPLQANFGEEKGIPFAVVGARDPLVPVYFSRPDGSDAGPYAIPPDPPVEANEHHHVVIVNWEDCVLYELSQARRREGLWHAATGAIFDLKSYVLRRDGWPSADDAGLPIFAGLVRYDEVFKRQLHHALRFTAPRVRAAHVWPARHHTGDLTDPALPAMGQRFRLRASFPLKGFTPEIQTLLAAMQEYGLILAGEGAAWAVSGVVDGRWASVQLNELSRVTGADFEAVDVSSLMLDNNLGKVRAP
jgi:hypothetical protein